MAVKKWDHYLQGRHFLIRTDHQSLKYLLKKKIHTLSQHQWLSKLLGYDYSIVYKPRRPNQATDALSTITGEEVLLMAISAVTNDLLKDIQASWETDSHLQQPIQTLQQHFGAVNSCYTWKEGILRWKGRMVVGNNKQLRSKVIEVYHNLQ